MKKKTILVACLLSLTLIGCEQNKTIRSSTADAKQAQATEQSLVEANRQIGMPAVKNFQQRKLMKAIYELCDQEDLICYAYTQSGYTGRLIYIGKCIGYGIPFSAQFTNPEKVVVNRWRSGGQAAGGVYGTLPQADPNGLYMPVSSSATWLMMVDPETEKPRPVYFEPTVTVSPFKLPNADYGEKVEKPLDKS